MCAILGVSIIAFAFAGIMTTLSTPTVSATGDPDGNPNNNKGQCNKALNEFGKDIGLQGKDKNEFRKFFCH